MRKYIALSVASLVALATLTPELAAQTLATALDTTGLAWTSGGSGNVMWTGQTGVNFDGVDAAQSGTITHNQETWMETTVTGPGTLSFWWKVFSEPDSDFLEFYVDGLLLDQISGDSTTPERINWQYRLFDIDGGIHTFRWRYVKDDAFNSAPDHGWVDQVIYSTAPPIPLTQALDTCGYVWTSGGNTNPTYWSGQTNVTHDGADAAESGAVFGMVNSPQESWMETGVSNATNASVSFWWKVSSRTNDTFLEFYIGGIKKTNISGEVNWRSNYFAIPNGNQALRWRYIKTNAIPVGQDRGWVDQIIISPFAGSSPAIATQPLSQTNLVGDTVLFSVEATGPDALNYQWRKGGAPIANATNAAFTITNVQAADAGGYSVVATSACATVTSVVATLTVNIPPNVTQQPISQSILQGQNATFSVTANGTAPLAYQWRKDAFPILNRTNSILTLTNVQSGDAAGYSVLVTNAYGSVTSSVATLTIESLPLLRVTLVGESIKLSWPVSATSFLLQAADSLPVTWADVPQASATNGPDVYVTLPLSITNQFFRLRN